MQTKVFVGQSALRIRVSTFTDLTNATSAKLHYKKPSGNSGYWNTQFETPKTEGVVYYDLSGNELDEAGPWKFWIEVAFNDGRVAYGQTSIVTVYSPGE